MSPTLGYFSYEKVKYKTHDKVLASSHPATTINITFNKLKILKRNTLNAILKMTVNILPKVCTALFVKLMN